MFLSLAAAAIALVAPATAQPQADARYYDFWPGTWCEVADGRPDPARNCFIVEQGIHASAFEEEWVQHIDGTTLKSRAMRAWDPIEGRWMLVWISAEGHFQVWTGRKVGDDWYIVRGFEQEGRKFLSRQAWIPFGTDRLVRIMERSFDEGATWQPRYRTEFGRVPDVAR